MRFFILSSTRQDWTKENPDRKEGHEVKLIVAGYIAEGPSLTHEERLGLKAWLSICNDCRKSHCFFLVKEYGTISDEI